MIDRFVNKTSVMLDVVVTLTNIYDVCRGPSWKGNWGRVSDQPKNIYIYIYTYIFFEPPTVP